VPHRQYPTKKVITAKDLDQIYLEKFLEIAQKIDIKLQVHYLVNSLKFTHQTIKDRKSTMLNNYINYCAVKIQKVFRGFIVRKLQVPLRVNLGHKGLEKLQAVMIGWRVRRIMRLKEAKTKIRDVFDHDNLDLNDMDLEISRRNTCAKFIQFVNTA
jgi:hypothetical protein